MTVPRVTAYAPATVSNVAVGFDLLGFSADVAGDHVTLEINPKPEVILDSIAGVVTSLPSDPRQNTATAGLLELVRDQKLKHGFKVSIQKGIPLGSGMGGSAASAVAAVVAANAFLEQPLSLSQLLRYALVGETVASGSAHADNIAPCLFGGLTLARGLEVTQIPVPAGIWCVLVHPHLRVDTREARKILKTGIPLKDHVRQAGNLAAFISGCYRGDLPLIRSSLEDILIEPQRAHLIPGFAALKTAALDEDALGFSISGSGPSVFAWVEGESRGRAVQAALTRVLSRLSIQADSWVTPLKAEGAKILKGS